MNASPALLRLSPTQGLPLCVLSHAACLWQGPSVSLGHGTEDYAKAVRPSKPCKAWTHQIKDILYVLYYLLSSREPVGLGASTAACPVSGLPCEIASEVCRKRA